MTEKEGRISLKVKEKRIYFEADLWLLGFLTGGLLVLIGRPEIVFLLEKILEMVG